jgi:Skp family chaperone for outer membrane proteins
MNRSLDRLARNFTLAALVLSASAASTLAASRVAVVDMALVYKQYPEVVKTTFFLKQKKDEYQAMVDKERRKIEEISGDLKEKRSSMSETQLREKENEKRRLLFQLQEKFQGFKEKLQDLEKEEFEKIRNTVKSSLAKLVRRKGYELVIEKQWLYYGESEDLTAALITSLGGEVPGSLRKSKRR